MTTTSIQTLAAEVSAMFRTETRTDGSTFITYDDVPQWVNDMAHAAHNDMAPDDWKYAFIVEALDAIAENEDADDVRLEADIYTHELLKWLSSNLQRPGYCDEAMEELGGEFTDTVALISLGQYHEKNEVLGIVRSALEAQIEATDDDANEAESIDDAMFRAGRLDRSELVKILENIGIECYDTEDTDTLLEAIRANLMDGTLDQSDID